MRTALHVLKCGTQVLSRTQARETCCETEKEHHRTTIDTSKLDRIATLCRIFGQSLRNDTNAMIWENFMTASMLAAVHLGKDFGEQLRVTR